MEEDGSEVNGHALRNITELPNEILLQIFGNLDLLYMQRVVSVVCKKFNSLVFDELPWKQAVYKDLLSPTVRYPYLEKNGFYLSSWRSGRDLSWRQLYTSLEKGKLDWFTNKTEIPVESTSGVIHIMKDRRHILTGSRDRTLQLWSVEDKMSLKQVPRAHNGWVSAISTMQDNVVSCGWDSCIKVWSCARDLAPINSFLLDTAVMAVTCKPRLIAACTFPHLVLIDPRIGRVDWQSKYTSEGGSLMQLQFWENSIIVTSRTRRVMQFDLRMKRPVINRILLIDAAPNVLDIYNNMVYVGDCEGKVHLLDPHDQFEKIETLKVCPRKSQVRVLAPRKGYMVVGTSRGDLRNVMSMKGLDSETKCLSSACVGTISAGHYEKDKLALLTLSGATARIVVTNI